MRKLLLITAVFAALIFLGAKEARAANKVNCFGGSVPANVICGYDMAHIHGMTVDEEGKISTGEMLGNSSRGLYYFLRDQDGEYVLELCSTRPDGDDPESHWFNPGFGRPPKLNDNNGPKNDPNNLDIGESQTYKHDNCIGSEETNSWNNSSGGGGGMWMFGFEVGKVYTIEAYGQGGNAKFLPDTFSEYYGFMTVTINDKSNYSYAAADVRPNPKPESEGSEEWECTGGVCSRGPDRTYRINTGEGKCTTLSSDHPCSEPRAGMPIFWVFSSKAGGIIDIINTVLTYFTNAISAIIGFLNEKVLDFVLLPHSYFTSGSQQGGLPQAWAISRGIANSLFVLALIIIAMANILRIQIEKYDIRAALPRLVVSILLVNFSLLVIGLLVDLSNILALGVMQCGEAGCRLASGELSGALALVLGGAAATSILLAPGGAVLFVVLIAIILLLVYLILFLVLAFRVAVIVAMVAIAPVAFMLYALPTTAGLANKWWSNFVRFLFMGPVIVYVLLVAQIFTKASLGSPIINITVAIAFIVIADMVPVMLGGKAFAAVQGAGKKFRAWAGKQAFRAGVKRLPVEGLAKAGTLGADRGILGKAATAPIRGAAQQLALSQAGIRNERLKKISALDTLKNIPDLEKELSNKDKELSFASLNELGNRGLLEDKHFESFFQAHPSGPFVQQAIGLGLKNLSDDPLIGDVLRTQMAVRMKLPKLPAKVANGAASAGATIQANKLADLATQNKVYTDETAPDITPRQLRVNEVRRSYSTNSRAFSGYDPASQAAFFGTSGTEEFNRLRNEIKQMHADLTTSRGGRRGMESDAAINQIRVQLETGAATFSDAGLDASKDRLGKGFESFGNESSREQMIKSVLGKT